MSDMNNHLGLPSDYSLSFKDGFELSTIFEKITGSNKPVSPISLYYWYDEIGDFTKKNDKLSKIVKVIFNQFESSDRFRVLTYMNE